MERANLTDRPAEPSPERLRAQLLQQLESLYRSGVRQLPPATFVPDPVAAPAAVSATAPGTPPRSTAESARPSPAAHQPARSRDARPAEEPAARQPTSFLPNSATTETNMAKKAPARSQSAPAVVQIASPAQEPPPLAADERAGALQILSEEVAGCRQCPELAAARTQTVFGVGNPNARLCFFGEAPGADEDRQGEPFVGRAGKLLNDILKACGLSREDVYILNVLRCRPPGNRNPSPQEASNCRTFFERQLQIVRPEYICCLGSVPAQTLLETTTSIGRLRGRLHTWRFAQVLATYHPAYLLRNPSAKKYVWEDMQFLMEKMGIEIPKR